MEASAAKRAAIAADIKRVLRKHAISGSLAELHMSPAAISGPARRARATAEAAPAGPIRESVDPRTGRVVCFFRHGTFVCEVRSN